MKFPRYVYMLQHNVTKKMYIGSSANVPRRIYRHKWLLKQGCHHIADMQSDFNQHGDDFSLTILDELHEWPDRNREYYWMRFYNSDVRGIGYNYKDRAAVQLSRSDEVVSRGDADAAIPIR